jgi:hypothetical protein
MEFLSSQSQNLPTTPLAMHPDGTPMISIGEAINLSEPSPAADPEHSRQCLIKQQRKAQAMFVQSCKDNGSWNVMRKITLPGPDGPLSKADLEQIWREETGQT